ncbi:MAG: hypothetical protein HY895_07850 [Deltaproteobacteria bacterium]|nr:hypothetical protein [Deltaproteobacteria bacterium]
MPIKHALTPLALCIIRGIDRRMILTAESDRENFLERLSNLLTDSQPLCYAWELSIPGSYVAWSFKQDRSAVSRAAQRVDNDPKLMMAATTIMARLKREVKRRSNSDPVRPLLVCMNKPISCAR